ncbi:MAG: hypothetical protein IJJ23_08925 [Clostridia bacterium]|nr:hypothetical protein [Clostridia bacterium]
MIWRREQYLDHMTFNHSDGELFVQLFGPLVGLTDEWAAQGATADELSLKAFGFDSVQYAWLPVNVGAMSGIKPHVILENDREIISMDERGRVVKLCKGAATIPLPQRYVVETEDDWERVKPWYAFREDRIDYEGLKRLARLQREGTLILGGMPGGFDEPRELMGEENLCLAFYDMPDMIRDMLDTFADTCLKVYERVSDYLTMDLLHVHEDMAGRSGPLIGKKQIREFLNPYYHRIWDPLNRQGARLFSQDSDGDMTPVVEDFIDCGLNCMYPCEPQAGMDVVKLRRKYGHRVAFKGGIDKFALRGTFEDIRRELEYKLSPEMMGGGMIFGLDHLIPNGVPIENYRYYVSLGREMLGLPPAEPSDYVRMAF